jgi:hypothetical protein
MHEAQEWAERQFGHAELGDVRRTRRLVKLAAEVIRRPSGIVSQTCETSASREGAFRFLENPGVRSRAVQDAIFERTARDCGRQGTVFVPVDATSLSIEDDDGSKGLGRVGPRGGCGLHAVTALAVARNGTPLGIAAQELWVRTGRSKRVKGRGAQPSEGRYWLNVIRSVEGQLAEHGAKPWFQLDRGADYTSVLRLAEELGALITVRSRANRRLDSEAYLWSTLQRAPIRGKKTVSVPARSYWVPKQRRESGKIVSYYVPPRKPRTAKVVIRATRVELSCATTSDTKRVVVPMNAVYVRELGRRSKDDRIEWLLLTTHPIETRADVLEVVRGYTLRWRIEDFHRAWKDGLCRVEETKLRSRDAIYRWSTILAAVATRAMRLTHLARETPDALASTEFSAYELEAIFVRRKPKGFDRSCIPTMTLAQAIRWIADTAGYSGPWKGPPGATIVGRGLYEIEVIARAFEARDLGKM